MSEVDYQELTCENLQFLFFIFKKNGKNSLPQLQNKLFRDFAGGLVVENPPCNAGHVSSIPGRGKIPHGMERLSSCPTTTEPTSHDC